VEGAFAHAESDRGPNGSFRSFEAMMCEYGRLGLMHCTLPRLVQGYFTTWDFVAPGALKEELGAQRQKAQEQELQRFPAVSRGLSLFGGLRSGKSAYEGPSGGEGGSPRDAYGDDFARGGQRGAFGSAKRGATSHESQLGRRVHSSIVSIGNVSMSMFSSGSYLSRGSSRDDSGVGTFMSLPEKNVCFSPTNHGVAASFGTTKNAVSVHTASSLLNALSADTEVKSPSTTVKTPSQ
jgi:hypothetical protein